MPNPHTVTWKLQDYTTRSSKMWVVVRLMCSWMLQDKTSENTKPPSHRPHKMMTLKKCLFKSPFANVWNKEHKTSEPDRFGNICVLTGSKLKRADNYLDNPSNTNTSSSWTVSPKSVFWVFNGLFWSVLFQSPWLWWCRHSIRVRLGSKQEANGIHFRFVFSPGCASEF